MLEFEKKFLLTENEFLILKEIAGEKAASKEQINHYFDTYSLVMHRQGITCRIREKDGQFTATIKKHDPKYLDRSTEMSMAVTNASYCRLFNGLGLKQFGSLKTERRVLRNDSDMEIVLDHNRYLDIEDYELEIEFVPERSGRADEEINKICDLLEQQMPMFDRNAFLLRTEQAKSKSARFFERYAVLYQSERGIS